MRNSVDDKLRPILQTSLYWLLPRGIYGAFRTFYRRMVSREGRRPGPCIPNSSYKNLHRGKRCFILCNGPSVATQDLSPLANEIVFAVSTGYNHKQYKIINPQYHCLPQITYTDLFRREACVALFREIEMQTGDAELFISSSEKGVVEAEGLFKERKVNYICFKGRFADGRRELYDITCPVPGVKSVPLMCLIIAMYMGFKEIYLLGVDHNSFRDLEYKHAYDAKVLHGRVANLSKEGVLQHSMYHVFCSFAERWRQYRVLKAIAAANDTTIYNATPGSALDEFEFVDLNEMFR